MEQLIYLVCKKGAEVFLISTKNHKVDYLSVMTVNGSILRILVFVKTIGTLLTLSYIVLCPLY